MVKIFFKDLKINVVSSSSGVFTGTNMQLNWRNYEKINEGQGTISGDKNVLKKSIHVVNRKEQ
jgi:hypothetical protein